MTDVGRHPRIKLLTNSEVKEIQGYVGNFKARIQKKARYVDETACTACGACAEVCQVTVPSEFEIGLGTRKAIYQPFPQAVPSAFVVDMDNCLGNVPIACGKCIDKCEKQCINFDDQDTEISVEVGTVIVATGMDVYDPTELDEFGYTRYDNVITSMEFERLINAGGPTEGHLVRPTDHEIPKSVAFIQCVGSRSAKRGNPYCSNICCMNTVKDTLLIKDHYPEMETKVFYIDIRAFGKGFEDLYKRSREDGVLYIRGIPGEIAQRPETKNLVLSVENTETGRVEEHEVEMVVLALGVIPRRDSTAIQQLLTLSRTSDGFFLEAHPKLRPVDATTKGVFFAGCAESPKDIKDSVTQASASAARANILMNAGKIHVEAITSSIDGSICTACGICSRVCPYNAIEFVKGQKTPAKTIEAACTGCGTCAAECNFGAITMRHFTDPQLLAEVDSMLAESPEDKIVTFACNWCSYAGADFAGTSRLQYPPNARLIRTMCSGRVDESFVIRAFRMGAPVVLVSGCHFGDCHYIDANHWTQRRVEKLWDRLERKGIRPERLQLDWISAAEGQKFSKVMREMEELRRGVTADEIAFTVKVLAEEEEKERAKAAAKGKKQEEARNA